MIKLFRGDCLEVKNGAIVTESVIRRKIENDKVKLPKDCIPILYALTGSRAYGTHTDESDWDHQGVFALPCDHGLRVSMVNPKLSYGSKDPDTTVHELRKFINQCAKGGLTALETLFSPLILYGEAGAFLVSIRDRFVTAAIVRSHAGFMKGRLRKIENTIGLNSQNGIDKAKKQAKQMAHCYRLAEVVWNIVDNGKYSISCRNKEKALQIRKAYTSKGVDIGTFLYTRSCCYEAVKAISNTLMHPELKSEELDRISIKAHRLAYGSN